MGCLIATPEPGLHFQQVDSVTLPEVTRTVSGRFEEGRHEDLIPHQVIAGPNTPDSCFKMIPSGHQAGSGRGTGWSDNEILKNR